MTTTEQTSYTSEAISYVVEVTIDPATGVTTMVGATVRVDAINIETAQKVAGTAVVTDATHIKCTFVAGALAIGPWDLQTLASPPANLPQVVKAVRWRVKSAAF